MIWRVIAWVVVVALGVGFVKLVISIGNPWGEAAVLGPANAVLTVKIPGCADKPKECAL